MYEFGVAFETNVGKVRDWVREWDSSVDGTNIGTTYFKTGTSLSKLVAQQPQIQSNQIQHKLA